MNIYGVLDGITFPLIFEIYKPKSRLKSDDIYQSKPQRAVEFIVLSWLVTKLYAGDNFCADLVFTPTSIVY